MNDPRTDVVSNQYSRWLYPQPILDLPAWLENNWQWYDPTHAHRLFWPDREYQPGMDILVAGCGTNQAAVIAYKNPDARVVAIDVSGPSLEHHRFLADQYGLRNLELHLLPIEEVGSLNQEFDLIISTGVLHHLADPGLGLKALGTVLRPDGVIALMLYASFGRIGVEMMQSVFKDMGLKQNDRSVLMVKEAIAALRPDHPVRSYLAIAPDLEYDAGLVDTFLNGREQSYMVQQCIDLVETADLTFQDLFFKAPYYPDNPSGSTFLNWVKKLPREKQWCIMERVNFSNGCHFFTACHKDRPRHSYEIDFSTAAAVNYIPALRYRCALDEHRISRYNWTMSLSESEMAIVSKMDGNRTIAEILAQSGQPLSGSGAANHEIFERLWNLDFLEIHIR